MSGKAYPLPLPLLQAIVNYLQTRPWAEVNSMLVEIQNITSSIDRPIPFPAPPDEKAS